MIKAVIFDFGGVLARPKWSTEMIASIIVKKLAEKNIKVPSNFADALNDVIGEHLRISTCSLKEILFEITIKKALERVGIKISDALAYQLMLEVSKAELHEIRPETEKVLRTLKRMGLKIGVLSNTSLYVVKNLLEKKSLMKYIDALVLSRDTKYRKPHPSIYLEILKRLRAKPQEAIFVGDVLEIDIYGAKKIGMVSVLIGKPEPVYEEYNIRFECLDIPKNLKPDYTINSLEEIIEIVEELRR